MARRVPNDIYWLGLWCVLWGTSRLTGAAALADERAQALQAVEGAVALLVAWGLVRVRAWARPAGAALLGLTCLTGAARLGGGLDGLAAGQLLLGGWGLLYLLAPSTRAVFAASPRARPTLLGAGPAVLVTVCALGLGLVPLPGWAQASVAVALVVGWTLTQERLGRLAGVWLAARPDGLDRDGRRRLRRARLARLRGDLAAAEAALAPLPPGRAVGVLRGLVAADRARRQGGLARLVVDARHEPTSREAAAIAREARAADLEGLVAARAALIDGLVEDAVDARSVFALEATGALERLGGERFTHNAEARWHAWWAARRPRDGDGLRWLVARLWEADCLEAAAAVGARAADPLLGEATGLAWLVGGGARRPGSDEATDEVVERLATLPALADGLGALHADGDLFAARGAEAARRATGRRRALVGALLDLWSAHPEASVQAAWLLHLLTSAPPTALGAPDDLRRWWAERAEGQRRYEEALCEGLEAAGRDAWAEAEAAFARAEPGWPGRSAAAWNRALALVTLGRAAEAEPILRRLCEDDPERPGRWRRLADCLRLLGRDADAAAAAARVEQAEEAEEAEAPGRRGRREVEADGPEGEAPDEAELHGADDGDEPERPARRGRPGADEPTFALGLRLAAAGREEEARRLLDGAVEATRDRERLSRLVADLEAQGSYELAEHYQYEAVVRSLGQEEDGEDERDAEPA